MGVGFPPRGKRKTKHEIKTNGGKDIKFLQTITVALEAYTYS
jgi:hypothetical protein